MTATRNAPSKISKPSSTAETALSRRILLRGVTLFRIGAVVAALLLLLPIMRGTAPGIAAAVGAALALGAGTALRDRWWAFNIQRHELDDLLARSCRMTLALPIPSADGVLVQLARADLTILIRARGHTAFELRFTGPWRVHRKALVLRSVIAKQFEPPLPRIRIRLRRSR